MNEIDIRRSHPQTEHDLILYYIIRQDKPTLIVDSTQNASAAIYRSLITKNLIEKNRNVVDSASQEHRVFFLIYQVNNTFRLYTIHAIDQGINIKYAAIEIDLISYRINVAIVLT